MSALTSQQLKKLKVLFTVLKNVENVPKPSDVEAAITPLYNWLESMFENIGDEEWSK